MLLGIFLGGRMSNLLAVGANKGAMLLNEIRRRYPNYHPVLAIVDIAMNEEASLDLQFNCHKTVAKYIEPELKSIEVKGDFKTQQTVRVSLFSDEAETVPFVEASEVDAAVASIDSKPSSPYAAVDIDVMDMGSGF